MSQTEEYEMTKQLTHWIDNESNGIVLSLRKEIDNAIAQALDEALKEMEEEKENRTQVFPKY